MASTRADSAMLSHSALLHVPTNGRTASDDRLNGAKYRLPVATPQIGGGPRWTRDEIRRFRASWLPLEALFFRHGGRIDRPYGECRLSLIASYVKYTIAAIFYIILLIRK